MSYKHRLTLIIPLCFLFCPGIDGQEIGKNVLFLFSSVKYSDETMSVIEPSIRAQVPQHITFYDAYLDDPQVEEKSYRESLAETLRRRYAGVQLDVVIACNPAAIRFATEYRDKIFPAVPIVFAGIGTRELGGPMMQPGVTGVTSPTGFRETIELALHLQPETKVFAVLAGVTKWDRDQLAALQSELAHYRDRVKEVDLVGAPNHEMLARIDALPPHAVVIFQVFPQFSDRPDFGTWDLLAETTQRRPTYSAFPRLCISGCIGGTYEDDLKLLRSTGDLAARVLSGVPPEEIPIVHNTGLQVRLDWRALQRWQIPESVVPPGTQVLYREPTLWESGRKYFLAGIVVIFLQAVLIFALFWQRARRRKAELELGKSEQKFSRAFHQSPFAITILRASTGRYVEVNESFELQTGWSHAEVIGRTPFEIGLWVDPEQRTVFMKQLLTEGSVKDLEVQLRTRDGQIRTSLGSAELIEVNGERCVLSVFADISERKRAEEAISGFSRKLIEAQETERTRIARELHDDINQRVAMVAVTLKTAKQDLPASETKACLRLGEACETISDLETDIQALSHRLHSSKLEYLGLEAAASSFCKELSERQNVEIDFHCDGLPEELSSEVSLCLFRVLQEALHNAVKYSGVSRFEVSVTGASRRIQLRVHDSGAGFDPKIARNGHGLGLTSMSERLKVLSGELSIDTKPGYGTTILARVPLRGDTTAAGAAA